MLARAIKGFFCYRSLHNVKGGPLSVIILFGIPYELKIRKGAIVLGWFKMLTIGLWSL